MEQTPQTTLTKEPRAGEALSVRRLFTHVGVHPFETVEWETRTAAVGSFRQEGVEFPAKEPKPSERTRNQEEILVLKNRSTADCAATGIQLVVDEVHRAGATLAPIRFIREPDHDGMADVPR